MTNGGAAPYVEEAESFTKKYDEGHAGQSAQFRAGNNIDPKLGAWDVWRLGAVIPNPLNMPEWGTRARDLFLRAIVKHSTLFAAVVYGEATRVQNVEYTLTSENREKEDLVKYQDLLQTCDFGQGFDIFRSKIAQDLLTQDNGAFIELIGDNRDSEKPLTARPKSFAHIDAGQCWRTFSPEWPVIYINPYTSDMRIFHWTRVICMSSLPQPFELGRGMGLCAMSRSYEAGRIVVSTNQFLYEKVTGGAPNIYIANQPLQNLQPAMLSALLDAKARDYQIFRDPMFLSPLAGGFGAGELNIETLDFKSIPDGFDHKTEVELAAYMVTAGFGVDAREYWPATSSGATKADAEVQDVKGEAKGRAEIMNLLENALNWRVLPPDVTLEFRRRNALTDKHEAENRETRARTRATQIMSGELLVEEARRMAAAEDDIDPAFLEEAEIADDNANAEAVEQTGDETPEAEAREDVEDEEAKALLAALAVIENKAYAGRETFRSRMFTYINNMRREKWDASEFYAFASDLLFNYGTRAFLQGIRDGGAPDITTIGQLDADERRAVQSGIQRQLAYLRNLTTDFAGRTDAPYAEIRTRAELWMNKGLDGIYYDGLMAGKANPNMKWSRGLTEKSCFDCSNYDGRVYRKKTWDKYGIKPRADALGCGGFNCDCSIDVTDQPVTPGKPPAITGKKHATIAELHAMGYSFYDDPEE